MEIFVAAGMASAAMLVGASIRARLSDGRYGWPSSPPEAALAGGADCDIDTEQTTDPIRTYVRARCRRSSYTARTYVQIGSVACSVSMSRVRW